jgi:tight adherence protein B
MTEILAPALVAAGIVTIACGIASRVKARGRALARLLDLERADPTESPQTLVALMERAGAVADRAFKGTTTTARLQSALAAAGIRLRPGEFGVIVALAGLAGGGITTILSGSPILGAVVFVIIPVAGSVWMRRRAAKRRQDLEAQLPTVLQLLAGSLDSGASMMHAMEIVANEGDEPLAAEFARVVAESQVGRPLLDSLQAMADRCGSQDLDWTVEAIRIQYTTGGSLSDTLRVLGDFMRARVEVRAEVRALSAEARFSGKILTALPIGVGGFLLLFRRDYMAPLYTTSLGKILLASAAAGMAVGAAWMRRIVRKVEV